MLTVVQALGDCWQSPARSWEQSVRAHCCAGTWRLLTEPGVVLGAIRPCSLSLIHSQIVPSPTLEVWKAEECTRNSIQWRKNTPVWLPNRCIDHYTTIFDKKEEKNCFTIEEGSGNMITVYSHIFVGFFLSCMKICLHEYAKGALFPGALRLADAAKQRRATKWR